MHSPRKLHSNSRQPFSPRSPPARPAAMAIGIGDPVTDMVVNVSADELSACSAGEPGGCSTIDAASLARMLQSLEDMGKSAQRLPGGSAANVMRCLANLAEDTRVLCDPFQLISAPKRVTICGVASPRCGLHYLQPRCRFLGAAGQDETAERYKAELLAQGVEPYLVHPPTTTAHEPSAISVCLITPDGQRTMRTCLGASSSLSAHALPSDRLASCSILHCEGYTLFKPAVLKRAIAEAKAAGAQVSLDLASFEVVRACHSTLMDVLETGGVDIVFCNEDEMSEIQQLGATKRLSFCRALDSPLLPAWMSTSVADTSTLERCRAACVFMCLVTCMCETSANMCETHDRVPTCSPARAAGHKATHPAHIDGNTTLSGAERVLLQHCSLVVSTLGRRGARAAARDGRSAQVPACRVPVVDTVGAGDYFCGAFLAAHVHGASLAKAVGAGCAAGAQIVQCAGAHLTEAAWQGLRAKFADILAGESPAQSPQR